MNNQQMQIFLSVAKNLNFTSAANELQLSLSSVSRQISAIETELNMMLFMRDNRNVKLTQSGEYLYQEFSKVYNDYQVIVQNAQKIFQGYSGNLNIGVLEEVTLQGKMQDALHDYMHHHPNYLLDLRRGSFRELTDGVIDGEFDMILTLFSDISKHTLLQYKIIEKVRDGILISKHHPLSKKKVFHVEDFKNQTFILISQEDSPYMSANAIDYCKRHGFYPKLRFAPDLDTAILWAEAGLGIAFSYHKGVATTNPAMQFIPFENSTELDSKIVLAWNPQNTNTAIQNFLNEF